MFYYVSEVWAVFYVCGGVARAANSLTTSHLDKWRQEHPSDCLQQRLVYPQSLLAVVYHKPSISGDMDFVLKLSNVCIDTDIILMALSNGLIAWIVIGRIQTYGYESLDGEYDNWGLSVVAATTHAVSPMLAIRSLGSRETAVALRLRETPSRLTTVYHQRRIRAFKLSTASAMEKVRSARCSSNTPRGT